MSNHLHPAAVFCLGLEILKPPNAHTKCVKISRFSRTWGEPCWSVVHERHSSLFSSLKQIRRVIFWPDLKGEVHIQLQKGWVHLNMLWLILKKRSKTMIRTCVSELKEVWIPSLHSHLHLEKILNCLYEMGQVWFLWLFVCLSNRVQVILRLLNQIFRCIKVHLQHPFKSVTDASKACINRSSHSETTVRGLMLIREEPGSRYKLLVCSDRSL